MAALKDIDFHFNPQQFYNKKRLGRMEGMIIKAGGNVVSEIQNDLYYATPKYPSPKTIFRLMDVEYLDSNNIVGTYAELMNMMGGVIFVGEKELREFIEEKEKLLFLEQL